MVRRYISQRGQLVRSYYSGIGRSGIIMPAAFLVATAMGLVVLGLIFYTREVFHASPTAIGLLAGSWTLPYVFGCLVLRPAFSKVLPRYLIVGSNVGMFLCVFGIQVVPRLEWLFLLNAVYGLSISTFWPPLMGWLSADVEGKDLGRAVNRFNASWCTGTVISPYLCGWLSEKNPTWPLALACLLFVLTALFVFAAGRFLPRIREDRRLQSDLGNPGTTGAEHESILRYPAWVGLFACFFAAGTLSCVLPVDAQESLNLSRSTIGALFCVRGLLNVAGFVILGKTHFWHFKRVPMLAGQLVTASLFFGLAFAGTPLQIAPLLAGFGLAVAMAYSTSIFHGASGSRNRAKRMAIHESVLAGGVMAGSVSGGMVFQAFSAQHAYRLCGILLLISVLVEGLLWRKLRGAEE